MEIFGIKSLHPQPEAEIYGKTIPYSLGVAEKGTGCVWCGVKCWDRAFLKTRAESFANNQSGNGYRASSKELQFQ